MNNALYNIIIAYKLINIQGMLIIYVSRLVREKRRCANQSGMRFDEIPPGMLLMLPVIFFKKTSTLNNWYTNTVIWAGVQFYRMVFLDD